MYSLRTAAMQFNVHHPALDHALGCCSCTIFSINRLILVRITYHLYVSYILQGYTSCNSQFLTLFAVQLVRISWLHTFTSNLHGPQKYYDLLDIS